MAHPLIPIEVCPTSSVITGMIEHQLLHTGVRYYLQHKHPIVIGTDDPLLFQSSLTEEYLNLMQLDGLQLGHILQLTSWSHDFSFLPHKDKLQLNLLVIQNLFMASTQRAVQ